VCACESRFHVCVYFICWHAHIAQNGQCVPRECENVCVRIVTVLYICRVGQSHIYTVYIRYFWQGNHQKYGYIRCIYTVLANPIYFCIIASLLYCLLLNCVYSCKHAQHMCVCVCAQHVCVCLCVHACPGFMCVYMLAHT